MANYKAQLSPKCDNKILDRITKTLIKYRIPYEVTQSANGYTLIQQTGEPLKRVINRKATKPKEAQPEIICTQLESGRWEWFYTKTGKRGICSFPYDAKRFEQMKKEAQRDIDKRLSLPQFLGESYNYNEGY